MATTRARRLTKAPVGLSEAFADRRLLGIRLTGRQPELIEKIASHRVTMGAAGRQSGKSLMVGGVLVHNLTLRPDLDERAAGQPRLGLCVSNSREQAGIVLGYARSLVERSPLLRSRLTGSREDRVTFENGNVLVALPCQDRLMRGLVASVVCLDELRRLLVAWKLKSPHTGEEDPVVCTAEGRPVAPENLRRAMSEAKVRAGLDGTQTRLSLHSLRHSYGSMIATDLQLAPTTVAMLLGHTDASFSMKVYARDARDESTVVADVLQRAAAAQVGR